MTNSKNYKSKNWFKWLKIVALFLAVFILISSIVVFKFKAHLESNKVKVLKDLGLTNDQFKFNEASVSSVWEFPNVNIVLSNVRYSGQNGPNLLDFSAKKVNLSFSILSIFEKSISIDGIVVNQGDFWIEIDTESFLQNLFSNKESNGLNIIASEIPIQVNDSKFNFYDNCKGATIELSINELKTLVDLSSENKKLLLNVDSKISKIEFSHTSGVYLENSTLESEFNFIIKEKILTLPETNVLINNERYKISSTIDLESKTVSEIFIENNKANFSSILTLLPKRIQSQLAIYNISKPFDIKGKIIPRNSKIKTGFVEIDFALKENIVYAKNYTFENISMDAKFINRLFDDHRANAEEKNRFRLLLKNFNSNFENNDLSSNDIIIYSEALGKTNIKTNLNIRGDAKYFNSTLGNSKFLFEKGSFDMMAIINGPLIDLKDQIRNGKGNLVLKNLLINYTPSNLGISLDRIFLEKNENGANFEINNTIKKSATTFALIGSINNVDDLILNAESKNVSSRVQFVSEYINWKDVLSFFDDKILLNTKINNDRVYVAKRTVAEMYNLFKPTIDIYIDSLDYFDQIGVADFRTTTIFNQNNIFDLQNTSFDYKGGMVKLEGSVDIGSDYDSPFNFKGSFANLDLNSLLPSLDYFGVELLKDFGNYPEDIAVDISHQGIIKDTVGLIPNTSSGILTFSLGDGEKLAGSVRYSPDESKPDTTVYLQSYVNTNISLEGEPSVFNDFFKNENFIFDKGRFFVEFNYNGDIVTFDQLLNEANVSFSLIDGEVLYKDPNIVFPLTDISLTLNEDIASFDIISDFNMEGPRFEVSGIANNLSEILLGNTGKNFSTNVSLYAPRLEWSKFLKSFTESNALNAINEVRESSSAKSVSALKKSIKGLLTTFDPSMKFSLDTFVYSEKLMLQEVATGLSIIDSTYLVLDPTGCKFKDGILSFEGKFDISSNDETPFTANFKTRDFDVASLLESIDYLNVPSLQGIDTLSGKVNLGFSFAGTLNENGTGLVEESSRGILDFELYDVELKGFSILDSIAKKYRREERFEYLRFAPIASQVTIRGSTINVPVVEIQSNAFHMFVEGTLGFNNNGNLWFSIPVNNIWRPNLSLIPEKRGYAIPRRKVYVEMYTDENGENKFDLHFRKKKFYEDRGILEQYKIDKKKFRKLRRKLKN